MFIIVLLLMLLVLLHYIGYRMINNIEPYIPPLVTDTLAQLMQQISSRK